MGMRIVLLAAILLGAACAAAAVATCCLGGVCETRDEVGCWAAHGVPGYCHPGEACGAASCGLAANGRGRDIRAVKAAADVRFAIDPDPLADRYYTYYRSGERLAPCPGCPGSIAVPGSTPSTIPAAAHAGAVAGPPGEVYYYAAYAGCGDAGACCVSFGCSEWFPRAACEATGGAYQGAATTCWTGCFCCVSRIGACCLPGEACFEADPTSCQVQGHYLGDGTSCATATCVGTWGACCLGAGSCVFTHVGDCTARGGNFRPGTACAPDPC